MNNTHTPITDAATIDCGWDTTQPVVAKTFAQELERELEAASARIQSLADALSSLIYSAERAADLILSITDRYEIDAAIESAKEILEK